MDQYFGIYQEFDTVSKNEGSDLLGADNLVGDYFEISLDLEDGVHKAWLVNRFDKRVGFFDATFSRRLSVFKARGFVLKALLSFVAYSEKPDPGHYWGQMAVFCYDPAYEQAFGAFVDNVSERLQEGIRPKIDLGENAVAHIVSSDGTWLPKEADSMPPKEKGSVIMKSKRSFGDRMVEQGRSGNKGCYTVSILFIVIVVVLIVVLILFLTGVL